MQPERHQDCPSLQTVQVGKGGTPTMGGLLVLGVSGTVAALAGGLRSSGGWMIGAAMLGFGALGLLDDILKFRGPNGRGLRTLPKLAATVMLSLALAWGLFQAGGRIGAIDIPWLPSHWEAGSVWVLFAALVLVGASHAVNLTDGMDGLASGCLLITFSAFLAGGLTHAMDPVVRIWCAALAGSCAGFLWFNGFPACVFLGDVGALGLGAALGAVSLMANAACWLVLVGGVFVIEALSVMLQVASYKWRGRRIFRVAPIHHHFQVSGISEPKLIVRFWLLNLALAVVGLALKERG
jgi:phospho-N-acetylmuramoyl-pentapeptide-transferase